MIYLVCPLEQPGFIKKKDLALVLSTLLRRNPPPTPLATFLIMSISVTDLFQEDQENLQCIAILTILYFSCELETTIRSIYHTEFSNMRSFIRICCRLMNI